MVETVQDFVELFQCLNAHKARYLVVGGYAVAFYGYPRFTGDLDLFVDPSEDNARNVLAALDEFGFAGLGLQAEDFSNPERLVSLGYPPERVDIVCDIDGVSWQDAWARRFAGRFGDADIFFISKEDLITNKKEIHRPQDTIDVEYLLSHEEVHPPA